MFILKMNDTTVECSIAASELHQIGLTPEAIIKGDKNTNEFMAQLNKEVSQRLGYDPKTEVMMMSRNMMNDGSIRIFAVKMSNEDIQKSADRIRGAAETILKQMTQEKIDEIKYKTGQDKAKALTSVITNVSQLIEKIYDESDTRISAEVSKVDLSDYTRYIVQFDYMDDAFRFSKVVKNLPIEDSSFYKCDGYFFLILGYRSKADNEIYDLRKTCLEYGSYMDINPAMIAHVEETGEVLCRSDAVLHLAEVVQ